MALPSPSPRNSKSRPASPDRTPLSILHRLAHRSFAADYLGLVLLLAAYIALQALSNPWHRLFRLDDPRIAFPHAEVERVPVSHLLLYAAALPLLALLLWLIALRPPLHKAHVTLLGLSTTLLLTTFLTDTLKDFIGRPRPDLLARCNPAPPTPPHALVTLAVCTEQNPHTLHDGWRSFPSGHSSFAFAGLGYTALFLASQLHAIRPRASLAVALVCLAPLLGAALIAISRLEDYRHDFADVISGSALGFAVAYFNWRRYYPSLLAQGCDEPHASPASSLGGGGKGFERLRDEEEGFAGEEGERFGAGEEDAAYFRQGVR
ncbi:hypothetical protein LTR08_002913 [Meristemomyces frigidus]|nr:hypothetical protein LTR08_002913 [Meristemomyces frigidus]